MPVYKVVEKVKEFSAFYFPIEEIDPKKLSAELDAFAGHGCWKIEYTSGNAVHAWVEINFTDLKMLQRGMWHVLDRDRMIIIDESEFRSRYSVAT